MTIPPQAGPPLDEKPHGSDASGAHRSPGRSPAGNTRARVLAVARDLCNAQGLDKTTTREVAAAAGINEGNLYYYFRTKRALAEALFAEFATQARALFTPMPQSLPHRIGLLRAWFELSWTYRFIFRDTYALETLAPALSEAVPPLSADMQAHVRSVLVGLRAQKLLKCDDEALDQLLPNLFIVARHWMNYLATQPRGAGVTRKDLSWGFGQAVALLRPYFTRRARALLMADPGLLRLDPGAKDEALRRA